ncbi:ADP-ribosylation factor-like protein 9 isoform X11 [Denticeps clupeoides]|uniref:ADP-ribosylation factor-like protein 9 isoform X11 n=1 Tax=Denticeps clupeoides TaxID=299321 RepID=UPI0010A41322|nr:ADP-ribosylation factor-like protein 9 isoform X11 [Denticeps clupeoides]
MATWLAGQIQVDMAAGQDGERLSTTFHLHRCKTGRKPAAQRGTFLANRIAELARHKSCKSVWATTPCRKLAWGNQELIRPLTYSALGAVPSERIEVLAKPKRDFSALDTRRAAAARTGGDIGVSETPRPSCRAAQYQHVVRLSTPKSSCRVLEGRRLIRVFWPVGGDTRVTRCENGAPHAEAGAAVRTQDERRRHVLRAGTPRAAHPTGFPSGEDRQSVPARQQPVLTQAAHEGLRPQPGAGRVHSGTPAASIMEVNAPLLLLFS